MTDQKQWLFIINPTAGNGFAGTFVPELKEMVKKHNLSAEYAFTDRKGHAEELTRKFSDEGYKKIIAVGGDGTINEIARPLIGRSDVTMGIVPAGTGNDFIQILGFPNRFEEEHWDIFFNAETTGLDVGKVNDKIFINGMGIGFDAEVAAQNYEPGGDVKKGGKDKYIWHIVKTLLWFKEGKMKQTVDGKTKSTNCFINTTSIGRRFAGGFFLTPKAIADDGLLDVCMVQKLNLLQRFKILLKVPKGTHITEKEVNYYQTSNLRLEFEKKVPFHVDGELFFDSEFDISLHPKAVNTIYNPKGNHFFNNQDQM